jgi:hypothetical protein
MPSVFVLIDEKIPPAYEEASDGPEPLRTTADYARFLK